ncbi:MAG TPA: hypothetical protein PKZ69_08945, partial [Candidatus Cloacimonadota bacterium]|nr:hypothetical protein [Candidatus Cloacimonadota bacterium]
VLNYSEKSKQIRQTTSQREKIIDNVTRLYISVLKSDSEITAYEINILYSLLINIFRRESISWEVYIRQVVNDVIDIESVLTFLNQNLTGLDKIRILLSIIVMSFTEDNFSISDITYILDLAKKLNIETDGFMDMIAAIEHQSNETVAIKGFKYINYIDDSIFTDYLLFGRGERSNIQFSNKKVYSSEFLIFMVDKFVFLGTNNHVSAEIDGKSLQPNQLVFLPRGCKIRISSMVFDYKCLNELYKNQQMYDVIDFRKTDYNFKLINNHNKFSININNGTVFKNQKLLPKNRSIDIMYDDQLQIKGYAVFSLLDVIRERGEIGVENIKPKELFIIFNEDFFSISRSDSSKSLGHIEINDNKYLLTPTKKNWDIYLNNKRIDDTTQIFLNTDIITINKKN